MKKLLILFFFLVVDRSYAQVLTPYERGNGNQSTTFDEMREYYRELAQKYASITYETKGVDDNNKPIDVVIFNPTGSTLEESRKEKCILFVNNGIHPGEPDGIDATMMLMRDLASEKIKPVKNVIVVALASYNVSGMMNRGSFSRANQNGPEEYGFRGNARNYDLNRDFIKTDTKNSRSFQQIFQWIKPDVFIDNHVSNGADYQYTFTYISTNKERLGTILGNYFNNQMQKTLLKDLQGKGFISVPYVNIHGDIPDGGFPTFMDSPRYATGYTSLFNVIGTVVETHMLKSYKQRVKATYDYMLCNIDYMEQNYNVIKQKRAENLNQYKIGDKYAIAWKLDSSKYELMDFKGFQAKYKPSDISSKDRLWYDREAKFSKQVKLYNSYIPIKEITVPKYYVIPQSEWRIIDLLKLNQIKMIPLKEDSVIMVEQYRINDFKTTSSPYEGHYLHFDTDLIRETSKVKFNVGDLLVPMNQDGVKFLLETLEPEAIDSYFNWNFFDAILGQKEYYSAYVFEDTAAKLLEEDRELRTAFEREKTSNPKFAENGRAQLDWIYKHSPYYERSHLLYPIFRIN
ncbi:M14 family zinc carboxypeptidase [Sphingobacterium sp. UGAL515B_05]|uniref:M14 family zinc carboxypeptidase n=2 Tax=unclassified Sphingobacterium TaxID=2609468 RepID=UPI0029553DEC|nr:M14 family zinc carboxypeptidase [Sphingobacterium sp. UGAL515B_05]WON93333.1 M14 family zinc carboxypeptidase [Sphingobacterium sp. UGAL515B_05]